VVLLFFQTVVIVVLFISFCKLGTTTVRLTVPATYPKKRGGLILGNDDPSKDDLGSRGGCNGQHMAAGSDHPLDLHAYLEVFCVFVLEQLGLVGGKRKALYLCFVLVVGDVDGEVHRGLGVPQMLKTLGQSTPDAGRLANKHGACLLGLDEDVQGAAVFSFGVEQVFEVLVPRLDGRLDQVFVN